MVKRILFRCDGGSIPEVGTGHIARALTLANAFIVAGLSDEKNIIFLTRGTADYQLGRRLLESSKFDNIHFLPDHCHNNTNEEIESILRMSPSIVIMDRLETEVYLIESLKKLGIIVITFDDMGSGREAAHLAVNAILFQNIFPAKNMLIGYPYLILPKALQMEYEIKHEVNMIVVSFGGYDNRNLIYFFLESLKNLSFLPFTINIIVGEISTERYTHVVQKVISSLPKLRHKIHVLHRPSSFYNLLQKSDVAIVAGGLFVFECLMRGIPCIGIPQYPHQLESLQKLADLGTVILGSDQMTLDHEYFLKAFQKLLDSYEIRCRMSIQAQKIIDGNGLMRVMTRIRSYFENERRKNEKIN